MSGTMKKRDELNIALSLSGGGVRAVGFHLGVLDVLERLELLKQVSMLSTVSGGSLVGIGYSLYLKMGHLCNPPKTFESFYGDFFEFLPKLDTMVELIDGMDERSESGHRTMVGAMARIYRDNYFLPCYNDPKFEVFWDETLPDIHLKDMMFHASDFKTGLAFRFQYNDSAKNDPDNRSIGNRQVFLKPDHAKELYMADIMTTSACLPGLLEPMFMPQDYRLPQTTRDQIRQHFQDKCFVEFNYVALMDGGMLDNQGVTSILLNLMKKEGQPDFQPWDVSPWEYSVDWREHVRPDPDRPRRWVRGTPRLSGGIAAEPVPHGGLPLSGLSELEQALDDLDLLIISDTPTFKSREGRFFPKKKVFTPFTGLKKFLMGWKLKWFLWLYIFFMFAGLASAVFLGWAYLNLGLSQSLKWGLAVMLVIGIVYLFLNFLVSWMILRLAKRAEEQIDDVIPSRQNSDRKSFWHYIRNLKAREAWLMIKLRLLSVMRLASEIFLNRVRQLCYRWVLEVDALESKVIPNEIFKLRIPAGSGGGMTMTPNGPNDLPGWLGTLDPAMKSMAEDASEMATQIYLDKMEGGTAEDNLKLLAACGNMTTCYNILEHLWQVHGDGSFGNEGSDAFSGDAEALKLFEDARDMWKQLKADPYFYVNDRLA